MHATHEDADSRNKIHLATIQPPANVVLRTIDTDVLIIALGGFSSLNEIYSFGWKRVCILKIHSDT